MSVSAALAALCWVLADAVGASEIVWMSVATSVLAIIDLILIGNACYRFKITRRHPAQDSRPPKKAAPERSVAILSKNEVDHEEVGMLIILTIVALSIIVAVAKLLALTRHHRGQYMANGGSVCGACHIHPSRPVLSRNDDRPYKNRP